MKLEEQVCSLELAKKLKLLGVKQESHFVWRSDGGNLWHPSDYEYEMAMDCCAAFTVAELGAMLPVDLRYDLAFNIPTRTISGGWRVDLDDEGMLYAGHSEADARAEMLIHLLERGQIRLTEITV